MEECPDGKQHFIYPNLPSTAKTALFAVTDGRMPGGNYYCHVCTGNTGLQTKQSLLLMEDLDR